MDAGIDLIISDHHLPGESMPVAYATINPRRADCTSADKDLAAVGVAYKLALAVTRLLGADERPVHSMLDLVALATVADVAPLRGENRVFVRLGLKQMMDAQPRSPRADPRGAARRQAADGGDGSASPSRRGSMRSGACASRCAGWSC